MLSRFIHVFFKIKHSQDAGEEANDYALIFFVYVYVYVIISSMVMKDIKFTVCLFVCLFVSVCRGRSSSETAENLHKDQGLSNSVSSPTCVLQSPISTAIGPMRPARGAKSFF